MAFGLSSVQKLTTLNRLSFEKQRRIIHLLLECNSIRAISRLEDVSVHTVLNLLKRTGNACWRFHNQTVKDLSTVKRVQCDETWSFIDRKQKNITESSKKEHGDCWTWLAICSDSRLMISWLIGKRTQEYAHDFMFDLAYRLNGRIQLTTDGYKPYLEAVENRFYFDIDYAMLEKKYGVPDKPNPKTGKKSNAVQYIGAEKKIRSGKPDPRFISTSFIERVNLTIRNQNRRCVRDTICFSKKLENHCYQTALFCMYYNFVRIHGTFRVTPAMQAGITKKPMTIDDIVRLAEHC